MEAIELTAYLCNRRFPGIEVMGSDADAVSVNNAAGEVTVKMVPRDAPPGCLAAIQRRVTARMEPDPVPYGGTLYHCQEDGDFLRITYPQEPEHGEIQDYPEFTVKNPDHCHWIATQILATGPARCDTGYGCVVMEVLAPEGGGDIPENKEDVFPALGGENTFQMTDNQVTPGMLVAGRHFFFNGAENIRDSADSEYYTSEAFTAGEITAINGSQGDPDITYDVSIEGETVVCRPSDWVEWEVGDWVIVLKAQNIIVPMKIGEDGA